MGYDVDEAKVAELNRGEGGIEFTTDAFQIKQVDFVIIAVPTPVTKAKDPDLSYVMSAARTIGQNLKKGAIVVLESTVYPRATEEVVKPILEVTTQVPKPLSGDFTIQELPGTWAYCSQTGNLTAECAEGRRGEING